MNNAIKVKTIIFRDTETKHTIFKAAIMEYRPRLKKYKETKDVLVFTGQVLFLTTGDLLQVEYTEKEHLFYGRQNEIIQYSRILPGTTDDIKTFLMQHVKGLGIQKATLIVNAYGIDTLDVIQKDPTALDFVSLGEKTKKNFRDVLLESTAFEEILMFLKLCDVDHQYALPIFNQYQENAEGKLRSNPFSLYLDYVTGFIIADKIAFSLGFPADSPCRINSLILACIKADAEQNGNLFILESNLMPAITDYTQRIQSPYKDVELSEDIIKKGLQDIKDKGLVVIDKGTDSNYRIYTQYNYNDETKIVDYVEKLNNSPKRFAYSEEDISSFLEIYQEETGMTLAEKQKDSVYSALTSPVSIITGGPGTGKTQTVKTIFSAISKLSPDAIIKVCAPTGRAAVRAEEMTGTKAATIHKTIKLYKYQDGLAENGLECDFLIIDEFSMVDAFLCHKLFRAVCNWARVIVIGDVNQLPSVGPGLVLRDFISSNEIPTTVLDHVFRQASKSNIIKNSHQIINTPSEEKITIKLSKKADGDFYFMEREKQSDIQKAIVTAVSHLKKNRNIGMNQIQILSPVKEGDLGTKALNNLLQEEFNQGSESFFYKNTEFRIKDKVIHVVNDYDLNTFNGEIGEVIDIDFAEETITVEYPEEKIVVYHEKEMDELELAYATTIHKSQGSEFSAVIIPIHESLLFPYNKNSIYTACTRAKKIVVFIGSKDAFSKSIRKDIPPRNSMLAKRIQEKFA